LSVIGAVLATAIVLALFWPSGRDSSTRSVALAAADTATTDIAAPASANVFAASELVGFDREQAWDAVSSGTHRAHYCGLRGVDTAIDVTFAPSGKVTFVTVVGDGSLPPIALHCVDQLLFGLRISAFDGEPEVVSAHLDGRTGAVALR
jgi:hypothetical protein